MWRDADRDGKRGAMRRERRLAGLQVELLARGAVVAETRTDRAGRYSFKALAPDSYTVRLGLPDGYHGRANSGFRNMVLRRADAPA